MYSTLCTSRASQIIFYRTKVTRHACTFVRAACHARTSVREQMSTPRAIPTPSGAHMQFDWSPSPQPAARTSIYTFSTPEICHYRRSLASFHSALSEPTPDYADDEALDDPVCNLSSLFEREL
jgi:hypothetical protein